MPKSVGVDPSQEIREYLKMAGAPPLIDQPDAVETGDAP
jgi:hypothetical protein